MDDRMVKYLCAPRVQWWIAIALSLIIYLVWLSNSLPHLIDF
jgi:hypothetical protein